MSYTSLFEESILHAQEFWKKEAQKIDWYTFPEEMITRDEDGLFRWYRGGKLNTCYLALDRHVMAGRGEQTALIYDSPVTGSSRKYSYLELLDKVARLAAIMVAKGVRKGDTIIIYMPMIPESVVAMLACARIGAIHSVVFGGFAAHELAIRINDAQPRYIIMGSAGMEIDKIIEYKPIVDKALNEAHHRPEGCIVFQREFSRCSLTEGFDEDWESLMADAQKVDCVPLDAHDPLYILYTSGTTGTPKGIVRDNGGHAVALNSSMEYVYGIDPGQVFWAASDIGWVVGHSYIVYAPLIRGCTTIIFEGKPVKTPDPGTFWRIIEEYGVHIFFTAPTSLRAIKKEDFDGTYLKRRNLSSLKALFLAGERTDVATLEWISAHLEKPVIDHWWQTESGYPMLANFMGLELIPIKPGSAGRPAPGFDIKIMSTDMTELPPDTEGAVVIKTPLPPGCLPGLWKNNQRFKESYLSPYPGYYFSGDGGYKDSDGYVYITGRMDDVINVAGHRLSTSEMEEILSSHQAVNECAVVGCHDELKGHIPVGFVVLKPDILRSEEEIAQELIFKVRDTIGPVASFKAVYFVDRLPKTRSGKTLRKIIRAIADGTDYTIPSTIEDASVMDEITWALRKSGRL